MEIIVEIKLSDTYPCNTCFSRQEFKNALGDRIDVCRVFNRVLKSEPARSALVTHYERCEECIAAQCSAEAEFNECPEDDDGEDEIL